MRLSKRQKQVAVALLALIVLAAGGAFYVLRPSSHSLKGRFPRDFSDAEQHQICSAVHSDGLRRCFNALSRGQFSAAWRAMRYTKRQSVYLVRNQSSGGVWVHVGYADKSQPDGYFLTARYIMTKTNGQWRIGGSDL